MSVALSLESTKEKILKGSDLKPAEDSKINNCNCIFCHIYFRLALLFAFKSSGILNVSHS